MDDETHASDRLDFPPENPDEGLLLRRQDGPCAPPRRRGRLLFPVASAPVRQELAGGHAAGAVRGKRGAVPGPRRARQVGLVGAPVRLDFSGVGRFDTPDGVRGTVERQLAATERRAGLEPGPAGTAVRFHELIEALHERTGRRAVVLVDEYDKPILDALGDRELALANRDFLRSLYGVACDRHLRFVFLTGVSKLAGLFSGLNNLRHAGAGVLGHLRLHGRGTGCGLRPGTRGPGPGRNPPLVQRLQLARAGEGLQSVRPAAAVSAARVPPVLVSERHADLPGRDADAPRPAYP